MIHAMLLSAVLGGFPPDYVRAFAEAKTQDKSVYVLLTMGDECPGCVAVKDVGEKLRRHGAFTAVNVVDERRLGSKLLGTDSVVPQLLVFRWTGQKWEGYRYIGPAAINELAGGMHAEQQPQSGLMVVDVPVIRSSPNTVSPFLNDLLQRNRRPTGETRPGSRGHYATHFLDEQLRGGHGFRSGIYLGGGRGFLLNHPRTTLRSVAASIPGSLRGGAYRTYVIDSQQWWSAEPLYLLDEWAAYLAGAQVQAEHGLDGSFDALQAVEMMVYSFVVCQCAEGTSSDWLPATKHLIRIMAERTSEVCAAVYRRDPEQYRRRCGGYVKTLRDSPDAESLRQYIRAVWGTDWTKQLLGF